MDNLTLLRLLRLTDGVREGAPTNKLMTTVGVCDIVLSQQLR